MTISYRRRLILPALTLVLTLGVGVAYAAIPDAGGVIHGCFKKSGGDDDDDGGGKGSLRVIDTDKGEKCKKSETVLDWNQKGLKGDPGAAGPQGAKGDKGEPGAAGVQGTQGPQGVKGDKGEPGAAGARGDKGEPGTAGAQGDPGLKGDKGDQGLQGVQGPQGPQGVKGDKGDPGAPGPPGSAGTPSCPASTAFVARGNFCAETSLSNAANQLDAADQCSARLRELPSVSRAMYGYLNLAEYVWPGTEEIWTDDWIADDTVRTILIASILHPSPLGSANYAEPHRFFCVTTRA